MSRGPRRGLPPTPGVAVPPDRRFRRADVSPERRRRIGRRVLRVVRWGAPLLAILALAGWGVSAAVHSDLLRVRRIVVRGTTHLSAGEVEGLVQGLRQEPLLGVDFTTYRRRLLDSPWIADVALSRVLPATVTISVTERVPMALARLGAQIFLVDRAGVIIDEYGPQYHQFDLPLVDGLLTPPRAGQPAVPADRLALANGLLGALGTRVDLRRHVSQIDVSRPRDATVLFDDDPAWLHLGDERFLERLQNYVDLRPTLKDRFHGIDYVDLRFDDRVFIRAASRTTTAPAAVVR